MVNSPAVLLAFDLPTYNPSRRWLDMQRFQRQQVHAPMRAMLAPAIVNDLRNTKKQASRL
jgi:hypothetical protein